MGESNKSTAVQISGSLLAKNTILNFIGQVAPLLVAVVTIPYIIKGLGVERFGILSLAWVVLGYFSLFDLGLGRATTKFVAEALGKGETEKIPTIVWTSLLFIILLSIISAGVLIVSTPILVECILSVPFHLIVETKLVFYIVSASILITLLTAALSGVLEAYQRFDLVNMFRVPSNILTYFIPFIALFAGAGLPTIVLCLLIKNSAIMLFYLFYAFQVMPPSRGFLIDFRVAPSLFTYGWWIALHNVAVAILLYLDRFLVGVFLTMSAVTFYATPYELVSRTLIIPSSIMMVLFPAFSSLNVVDKDELQNLFNRALRYLILIMGLIIGVVFVFSREILLLWLGSEFAEKSTIVLQIFSIGVFLSSLAWLAGTLLQGIGKPRVVTIVHLIQVPIYIVLTWFLIKGIGIEGAAIAWALRILLSLFLLLLLCYKMGLLRANFLLQNGLLKSTVVLWAISGITIAVKSFIPFSLINTLLISSVLIVFLLIVIWKWLLFQEDRFFLKRTIFNLNFIKMKGGY